MRVWIAVASLCLAGPGCHRPPIVKKQTHSVRVSLDVDRKGWSSEGPAGTREYHWPYSTISTGGRGAPGEWKSGLAFDRDREDPMDVELRIFDGVIGAVHVEVIFAGPPSPDFASITFDHLNKVEAIMEVPIDGGAAKPYGSWVRQGVVFELRAPEVPAKISFLAWPAAR